MTRTRRPLSAVEALRNTRQSLGDGTLRGRNRLATPYQVGRVAGDVVVAAGESPRGETVALTGTVTYPVGGGETVASLDTIQAQHGFTSVDAAGDPVTLPLNAIYLAEIDIRWTDGYRDTSVPAVTLNGTPIGAVWPDDGGVWGRFVDQVAFAASAGDDFDIEVTPTDGEQHDAQVTVRVGLLEPLRTIAATLSEAPAALQPQTSDDVGAIGDPQTLDHGAPATGVAVGDLLVVAICGVSLEGAAGGSGGAGTLTVDGDWTVAVQLQHGTYTRQHFAVATKIADAADAAGTASYTHTLSGVQSHYGSCCCTVIPQAYGTTLSAAVSDMSTGAAITLTPPAGDWCLAVAMLKERGGIDDAANISVTAPTSAVELASHGWNTYNPQETSNARRGVQWIYSTSGNEDVTATPADTSVPVAALVLLGVTGGQGG